MLRKANRARRLLVIKCSMLLLNQKPNARILFRIATKLTLLLLLLSTLTLSLLASSAVCVCLQQTYTCSETAANIHTYIQTYVCVAVSFASCFLHRAFHTPILIRVHTYKRTHTMQIHTYFLPSSHSRGSFVIKLAGTTSQQQLIATKSWHSGPRKFIYSSSYSLHFLLIARTFCYIN